jgi:tetratricopeptide (TPR) repeat protein
MAKESPHDYEFEIGFFESILARDARYPEVVEILGSLYTKQGRIADGLKMDRRLVKLQPANATAHYNLACSLALSKRKTDALRSLVTYRTEEEAVPDPASLPSSFLGRSTPSRETSVATLLFFTVFPSCRLQHDLVLIRS